MKNESLPPNPGGMDPVLARIMEQLPPNTAMIIGMPDGPKGIFKFRDIDMRTIGEMLGSMEATIIQQLIGVRDAMAERENGKLLTDELYAGYMDGLNPFVNSKQVIIDRSREAEEGRGL